MLIESSPDVLTGRNSELAVLRGLVAAVAGGRGGSVWLDGEPGIGKSALITAGLAEASQLGCQVYRTAASELAPVTPLQPVLDAFEVRPSSSDAARAPLAAILRGEGAGGLLTPRDVAAVLAEMVQALADRLCAAAPVVLVLDDVQWADEATLGVWLRLARSLSQVPLLLVAACRPVPARAEVEALRRGLFPTGTVRLELGPLPPARISELVLRLVGASPDELLQSQLDRAGGNPLYVRELIGALDRDGRITVDGALAVLSGGADIPASLPAAIVRRLGFLSDGTRSALQLAAVLGPAFTVEDVAVMTGRSATDLVAAVQEAIAAGLLSESGDRLVFRHALIRQSFYSGLPASLRAAVHQQAARSLAVAGASAERVAEQLLAAPGSVDSWAIGWMLSAAAWLTSRAPKAAADLIQWVRNGIDPDDPRQLRLAADLATALSQLGRDEEVVEVAASSPRRGDPAVLGRLTYTWATALLRLARESEALGIIERFLAPRQTDPIWAARMRGLNSRILLSMGDLEQVAADAARVETDAIESGDRLAVGYAFHARSLLEAQHQRDVAAGLRTIDEALERLAGEPDSDDLQLLLLSNRAVALDHLGQQQEADQTLRRAGALAERVGTPARQAAIAAHAAEFHFSWGQWDDAVADLDDLQESTLDVTDQLLIRGLRALMAVHRDDRATLETLLIGAEDLVAAEGSLRYFGEPLLLSWALAAEQAGEPERALDRFLRVLDPASDRTFSGMTASSPPSLPDVVRVALSAGSVVVARAATEAAERSAREEELPLLTAAARHCRGVLDADPSPVQAAAEGFHSVGSLLSQASALEDAAVLLGQRGDAAAARDAFTRALEIYERLDAAWGVARTTRRVRPFGIRAGARGPRRRPASGWSALTPTEVKIAELVATGGSNPDIAAKLFLSRSTVQTHVSHILAKLGAKSRVDVVRQATQRQAGASL